MWWLACQIIGESFPISSSGHCFLLEQWYRVYYKAATPFLGHEKELLMFVVHVPTLIIITLFFFTAWRQLPFVLLKQPSLVFKIAALSLVAALATSFFYFVLKIQNYTSFPLGLGFCITAVLLCSLRWCTKTSGKWNLRNAFVLGVVQGCALLPGISRMGATYTIARWLGIPSRRSIQISFLIQAPLLLGAFFLGLPKALTGNTLAKVLNLPLGLFIIISMVCAWYALRFTVYLAHTNRWWYFALYLIVPLTAWLLLIMFFTRGQ